MKKKNEEALWVIDGSHYLFRSYFAITPLASPQGVPTNAVFGFIRMLLYLMEHHQMKHALITWDSKEPSWRKKSYEPYKAHREEMPAELAEQIPHLKEMLDLLGVAQYELGGYEADDIMYTAAEKFVGQYPQIILVTNDKDLYQLIHSPKVVGFHPALKVFIDEAFVLKKYGVKPEQMRDYLTLLGDSSDGIPGVPGVGAKTAAVLLTEHQNLKGILRNLDGIKLRPASKQYLKDHEDQMWKSYELIGLTHVPKIFDQSRSFEVPLSWSDKLYAKCDELGFKAIRDDFERISSATRVADAHPLVQQHIFLSLEDARHFSPQPQHVVTYDLKRLLHQVPDLRSHAKRFDDAMLLEYLSDPAAFEYQEEWFNQPSETCWKPDYDQLREKPIYRDLEFPLLFVLYDMEKRGIMINKPKVSALQKQWEISLDKMAKHIYQLAGTEFNILSPKQLSEILYAKCQLPVLKRKKTGPSTDASTLSELAHMHPIVNQIIEYRELAKIINTYTEPLVGQADENSVLHTELLQYGTASGRLSSRNPNLQNIPMRGDYAQPLRECFCPRPGFEFVSADYGQIELRILVHFSQCEALKRAFLDHEDVHTATAIEIFGKQAGKDLKTRTFAKAINFGILYGQTPYGLSKMLNIEMSDAKKYIDRYYKKYPEVKDFQQQVIQKLTEQGQVETFYGRIRKFTPEALDKRSRMYPHTLRAAFNTVLQGSSADLIKMAMLKTHQTAQKHHGYQVMQIHDELIFEIPPDAVTAAQKDIRQDMEHVVQWEVPLEVDIRCGEF